METTKDQLLNGELQILQPKKGFRISIDTILLASSVITGKANTILDVGCGVGGVMLCAALRIPALRATGLEIQDEIVDLCQQNIELNHLEDRVKLIHGAVGAKISQLKANSFDYVVSNPPYYESNEMMQSPVNSKATSHHELDVNILEWTNYCIKMCKPRGYISIIFDSARIDDLMSAVHGKVGEITLIPIWSKPGTDAKRFILRARKGVKTPSRISTGITIHNDDGSYTHEAREIIYNMGQL